MNVTKINSRSLVDYIDSAEKLYAKPIGGFKSKDDVEKYLPLVINKVGFYGEKKGDEIYWLPKNKLEFNTSEDVEIVIEGEVNLVKVPVNNGSGSLSYEGNGTLKVNGSVIHGGSGGSSSSSQEIAFNEKIVFNGSEKSHITQSGALIYTLAQTGQPTTGLHERKEVIYSNGDPINITPEPNFGAIDVTKTNHVFFVYDADLDGTINENTLVSVINTDALVTPTAPLIVGRPEINSFNDDQIILNFDKSVLITDTNGLTFDGSLSGLTIDSIISGSGTSQIILQLSASATSGLTGNFVYGESNTITALEGGISLVDDSSVVNVNVAPVLGLTNWHRFEDNLLDSSGNNNTLTGFENDPKFLTYSSNAIEGTKSIQGVQGIGKDVYLESTNDMTDDFTLSFWHYIGGGYETGQIIHREENDNIVINLNGDGTFSLRKNGTTLNTSTTTPLSLNSWNHICITFNNSTTHIKAFVNNNKDIDNNSAPSTTINGKFYVFGKLGATFAGQPVDDFRLYNRELSETEVALLYNLHS